MSGNGQIEGATQAQRVKQIQCPKCGKPLSVVEPDAQIINLPKISILLASHESPQACECGLLVQCVIRGVQVQWAWREVEVQTPTGIVTPPPGFRLT